MIRHTGGFAVAAISTRSRPFCRAMASACGGGMMPSCCPVSSMTRTSRTLMRSFTRVRSSRRGLRSNAITTSSRYEPDQPGPTCSSGPGVQRFLRRLLLPNFLHRGIEELLDFPRSDVPFDAAADRHGPLGGFPIPDHEHVGNLLQLGFAYLKANLLLPLVNVDPEAPGLKTADDLTRILRVTVRTRQGGPLDRG